MKVSVRSLENHNKIAGNIKVHAKSSSSFNKGYEAAKGGINLFSILKL